MSSSALPPVRTRPARGRAPLPHATAPSARPGADIGSRPGGRAATRASVPLSLLAAAAIAAAGAAACGDPADAGPGRLATRDAQAATVRRLPPPGDVALPDVRPTPGGYTVRALPDAGQLVGTVTLVGDPPPDTLVVPDSTATRACGPRLVDRTLVRRGAAVAGVVVWLADVRAGKPLPLARRYELRLERCALTPRALAAIAGGTLNVHGRDPLQARLRFVRWPDGEPLLLAPLTDAGQVIPDERLLAAPGVVEARGELHPWLRAWLLTFDHPYFATTTADGTFALADVPPGRYRAVAWHERLGRVEQSVEIRPGSPTQLDFLLSPTPTPSTPTN